MAARNENPALIGAVITLVIIVLILSVSTWYFWSQWDSEFQSRVAAEESASGAETKRQQQENAYKLVMRTVGEKVPSGTNPDLSDEERQAMKQSLQSTDFYEQVDRIDTTFQAKAGLVSPSAESYVALPDRMVATIEQLKGQLEAARDELALAQQQHEQEMAKLEAEKLAVDTERDRINQQLQARDSFQVDREGKKQTAVDLALAAKGSADVDKKAIEDKYKELQEKYVRDMQQKDVTIDAQKIKLQHEDDTSYEAADGKITAVSQRSNVVWIDLGMVDGLQRQQVFSVFDAAVTDFQNAKPKGSIEVTRVVGQHAAEARIISDSLTDPLLPDDLVISPTWQPGRKIHFALAGLMDYNGDGRSDAQLVKNLISINGGVIDVIVDETGKRTENQPVSIHTRYLVEGDAPSDEAPSRAVGLLKAEADTYGVERISVEKLLELMGYRPGVEASGLGSGSGSRPDARFRERRPTDAYSP